MVREYGRRFVDEATHTLQENDPSFPRTGGQFWEFRRGSHTAGHGLIYDLPEVIYDPLR